MPRRLHSVPNIRHVHPTNFDMDKRLLETVGLAIESAMWTPITDDNPSQDPNNALNYGFANVVAANLQMAGHDSAYARQGANRRQKHAYVTVFDETAGRETIILDHWQRLRRSWPLARTLVDTVVRPPIPNFFIPNTLVGARYDVRRHLRVLGVASTAMDLFSVHNEVQPVSEPRR